MKEQQKELASVSGGKGGEEKRKEGEGEFTVYAAR